MFGLGPATKIYVAVEGVDRPALPALDLLHHRFGDVRNQRRTHLHLVDLFQVALNLTRAHATRVHRQTLIDFLTSDLDFCFTLAALARHENKLEDLKRILQNARKGLETVRHFEERILDQEVRSQIHERADELERRLAVFSAH